jgi:iron complex outermembrane receptor protein
VPCTSWPCQTPDQFLSGSNPNLGPEVATSKTAGIVYSPSGIANLDLTLDWFNVRLENTISSDSVENILRDCYVLGNAARCAGIVRAPDGHITNMFFGLTNLGWTETEGWDLGVNYRMPETAYGQFGLNWQTTYTSKYDTSGFNAEGEDIVIGWVSTPGVFRVRSNLGLDWQMGDFGVSYTARYYSGMRESCVTNRPCTDPDRYANGETAPVRRTGSNTFHDIQAYVELPWNARASIGANNVTEHMGSIQFSAPNSQFPYYGGFDIGRFIYMRYTQRF